MNDESKEFMIEDRRTHRIFDYMEKHHSLLIASVSAFVTVGSLVTSILVYLYQCLRLQAWNVPMELLSEVKLSKYLYVAVIGMLYYCSIPIYQIYLQNIFQEQFDFFTLLKLQRKLIKKLYKYQKKDKEKINIKEAVFRLKRDLNFIKRYVLRKTLYMIFSASFLWSIIFILFEISIGGIGIYNIISGGIVLLLVFGITLLFFKHSYRRDDIEELKLKEKNVEDNLAAVELIEEICNLEKKMANPHSKNRKIKEYLSDKNIGEFAILIISAFISLCLFFIATGFITGKVQKGFWLFQDEVGQYYAIVYQNDERLVMEEAFINDDTITINVNKQLFKIYQENQFEYMEFEHVEQIKN